MTQGMTPLEIATLNLTPGPAPVDFIARDSGIGTMSIVPHAAAAPRIDEPSSMTLALIGIVTLAAYRGIQKRITGQTSSKATTPTSAASKTAKPKLIKPRRAA